MSFRCYNFTLFCWIWTIQLYPIKVIYVSLARTRDYNICKIWWLLILMKFIALVKWWIYIWAKYLYGTYLGFFGFIFANNSYLCESSSNNCSLFGILVNVTLLVNDILLGFLHFDGTILVLEWMFTLQMDLRWILLWCFLIKKKGSSMISNASWNGCGEYLANIDYSVRITVSHSSFIKRIF